LFPALSFDATERVLYYFLFGRTHLLGLRTVRFSLTQIATATNLSWYKTRHGAIQLRAKGCLRATHRNQSGSLWELVLPRQVLGPKRGRAQLRRDAFDEMDCSTDRRARLGILHRERGYCFYCLRRITRTSVVLDHVIPRSRGGTSSFRNMVACCQECNSNKGTGRAANFLRELYRFRRLSYTELSQRLSALTRITRGQFRITLPK
jgi:5-methylcytosine-specific restriction endonuclease McrA